MDTRVQDKGAIDHEPIERLVAQVEFNPSNAAEFWYERMASQSGCALPVIYQPFDSTQLSHFIVRGQIPDYAPTV